MPRKNMPRKSISIRGDVYARIQSHLLASNEFDSLSAYVTYCVEDKLPPETVKPLAESVEVKNPSNVKVVSSTELLERKKEPTTHIEPFVCYSIHEKDLPPCMSHTPSYPSSNNKPGNVSPGFRSSPPFRVTHGMVPPKFDSASLLKSPPSTGGEKKVVVPPVEVVEPPVEVVEPPVEVVEPPVEVVEPPVKVAKPPKKVSKSPKKVAKPPKKVAKPPKKARPSLNQPPKAKAVSLNRSSGFTISCNYLDVEESVKPNLGLFFDNDEYPYHTDTTKLEVQVREEITIKAPPIPQVRHNPNLKLWVVERSPRQNMYVAAANLEEAIYYTMRAHAFREGDPTPKGVSHPYHQERLVVGILPPDEVMAVLEPPKAVNSAHSSVACNVTVQSR